MSQGLPTSIPIGEAEVFAHSIGQRVLRSVFALIFIGVWTGYALFVKECWDDPQMIGAGFILLMAPIMAGIAYWCVRYERGWITQAFSRYELSSDGLRIRCLLFGGYVRWDYVRGCELPPDRRLRPPDRIILRPHRGRSIAIPLNIGPKGRLRELLEAYLPMLGPGGTQRVRYEATAPPEEIRRKRRERTWGGLGFVYGGFIFSLGCVLFIWSSLRSYDNYHRIIANPVEVPAKVIRIDVGDKHAEATVEYEVDGSVYTKRRSVFVSIEQKVKKGDRVTVQYLRGAPRTSRIKEWDMDEREWVIALVFGLPTLLLSLASLGRGCRRWASRGEEQDLRWSKRKPDASGTFSVAPASIETNLAAWPQQHQGWLVIRGIRVKGREDIDTVKGTKSLLGKAGVESILVGGTFLVIAPEQAVLVLGWLGREPMRTVNYWVLGCADAAEVERFILKYLADDVKRPRAERAPDDDFWRVVRFRCVKGVVGPFVAGDAPAALVQFIRAGVQRFAYWEKDGTLPEADLSNVVAMASAEESVSILIRGGDECEMLVRRGKNWRAERFIAHRGVWNHKGSILAPLSMRDNATLLNVLLVIFGAPWLLLSLIVRLVFLPLILLPERARKRELQEERRKFTPGDQSPQ